MVRTIKLVLQLSLLLLLLTLHGEIYSQESASVDDKKDASLARLNQILIRSSAREPVKTPITSRGIQCELKIVVLKSSGRETIIITNTGEEPVNLVAPGDGSNMHWRTPIVSWSFIDADSVADHPQRPPIPQDVLRCGHRNSLSSSNVFTLKPGQSRDISKWYGCLTAPSKEGKYRAACYYWNVPEMKWRGQPFAEDEPSLMKRVRSSTPIALISNEVEIDFSKTGITMNPAAGHTGFELNVTS